MATDTPEGQEPRLVSGKWRVTALYTLLTILLAFPLSVTADRRLLATGGDDMLFVWTLAWNTHALTTQPLSIFDANIFYPNANTLAYSENLIGSAFFAAPVLWLTENPVLAVNVVSLLSCILCGLGAYVLGRRLGLSASAAVLAGLIFAFSPARFFRFSQIHLTVVQWIPFALAARGESRSYEGSTQSIRRTTLTRMAMGTRETDQPPLWIATSDLPTSPGHPFYARLTTLLDGHHFDRFVEGLCDRFYAPVMGRPSLAPGRYFRLLLVGYFEGIDSERGMAWRATDSLAVRSFLRLAVDEAPPDHSTIARTRRLIDLETHRTVFTWVQQRLVEAGRLTGKTIAIDATTLEANAAMRSIVRRDTGESYQAFLAGLATASGVETPTREGLARLDRKRKKKTSNTDWTNPHDPDAKVTKMKDGRTHLAHKAEHAVDMETGAIVAVTLHGADVGDTTTIIETAIAAAEQVEDAQANVDDPQSLDEIVGDKGYHSNQTLIDLAAGGIRSYVSEPDRGRRDWSKDPEAQAPVYGNRRRMRGRRGRRLMRQRGERIERSFAHLYDTGGMRRTHLRGHTNILKRLLIHAGGFNLGLVMRHLIGIGTPRGLQGRVAAVRATLGVLMGVVRRRLTPISSSHRLIPAVRGRLASLTTFAGNSSAAITCTTGC